MLPRTYGVPFTSSSNIPLKASRVPPKSHTLAYHNLKTADVK